MEGVIVSLYLLVTAVAYTGRGHISDPMACRSDCKSES